MTSVLTAYERWLLINLDITNASVISQQIVYDIMVHGSAAAFELIEKANIKDPDASMEAQLANAIHYLYDNAPKAGTAK